LVIPVFILDPHLLACTPGRRQAFLFSGLRELDAQLWERGIKLIVRSGKPQQVLRSLLAETGAEAIYAEEDYTPYARTRDNQIARALPLELIQGQTVHHPAAIRKPDGKPYTVFTPYSKAWKAMLPPELQILPIPERFASLPEIYSESLPDLPDNKLFPGGEREGLRRLIDFIEDRISAYSEDRNRMDLEGTSSLSPYIRFGMLSLRTCVHNARQAAGRVNPEKGLNGAETWLNELIWREFYIQILYHFPRVAKGAFNPSLENIPWRNNEREFAAWKAGMTGVPVVDAAMRQMAETGWMHNRARMIAASYLVKDLLIDWCWGEGWFMANLLDGDPAANNGGWQWTAGTGTDAAPYFRIFNPVLQSKKFDPGGDYIRRWVLELAYLPTDAIHAPWEKGIKVPGYPEKPIVDHSVARERTLAAFQSCRLKTGS
jgi:deoxyribodipyrimidine photo-lyase